MSEWMISVILASVIATVFAQVGYWIGKRRGRAEANYRKLEY